VAESFAGLAPLQGTATATRTSGLSDDAAGLLSVVSQKQFPSRMAGWQTALKALTERAEGSPAALEGLLSPQLQDMARTLMGTNARISRTFGPYGGSQTPTAMGQARGALDLPGLYANAAIDAGQQRQKFLAGTSIMAPQGQQSTEVSQRPIDLANIARQWAGVLQAGSSIYGGVQGMQTPTSGTLPTTWDAYNKGGYANTTYAPFGTAPSGYGSGASSPMSGYPYTMFQ
jgi:hypothetical protein